MAEGRVEPAAPDTVQEGGFSNLPNEIIAKIFLAGTEIWRVLDPQGLPFPVLVSGVCARWHLLSQSTPDLWTFILPPLSKDPDACLVWTSKWLQRSGAMLISVVLDDRMRASGSEPWHVRSLIPSILGLVANNINRLRRLDILTDDSSTFEKFVRNLNNAPHLQQLSLCARQIASTSTSFARQSDYTKWSSLSSLPSLTRFRFQNISPPFVSNLTSLRAHHLLLKYEDVPSIFTASPHLTDLVLHKLIPIAGPIPAEHTPIQVPSLRFIAVSSHPTNQEITAVYLFSLIMVPNLVYLEVDGNVRVSQVFNSSLSSSKISTLRLSNCTRFSFHPEGTKDIELYHSLSGLQRVELLRTPARELLFKPNADHRGLVRHRSINFRKPSYRNRPIGVGDAPSFSPLQLAESHVVWPEIRSITLDTFVSDDLVSLVDFVKSHKGLQTLHLSNPAMRHLSHSLRRNGDAVFPIPSGSRINIDSKEGTKDVHEWLSKMVDIRLLQLPNNGLLDAERIPLSEMH